MGHSETRGQWPVWSRRSQAAGVLAAPADRKVRKRAVQASKSPSPATQPLSIQQGSHVARAQCQGPRGGSPARASSLRRSAELECGLLTTTTSTSTNYTPKYVCKCYQDWYKKLQPKKDGAVDSGPGLFHCLEPGEPPVLVVAAFLPPSLPSFPSKVTQLEKPPTQTELSEVKTERHFPGRTPLGAMCAHVPQRAPAGVWSPPAAGPAALE